jgi:hypothetical protein
MLAGVALLSSCAVGSRHTSDAELVRRFLQHEADFNLLATYAKSDAALKMVSDNEVRYGGHFFSVPRDSVALADAGLSGASLAALRLTMRRLGVAVVFAGAEGLTLRVDESSISNGASEKGFQYTEKAPRRLRNSLDDYRIADADRDEGGNYSVAKRLSGNWYLYLFVNR